MYTCTHTHAHPPCSEGLQPPLQAHAHPAGTAAPLHAHSPPALQPRRAHVCTHTYMHTHTEHTGSWHRGHAGHVPGTRRGHVGDVLLCSAAFTKRGAGTRGLPLHPTPCSPPRFAGSPSAVVTGPRWRCQQGKPLRSPRCVAPSPANKPPLPAARTHPATLAHACPPGRGVPGGRSPLRQAHVPAGRPPAHGSAAGPPRREAAGAKNGAGLTCQRHVTPQPARWGWRGLPAPQDEEEEEGSAHSHGPAPTPTSAVPRSPWPPCPLQVGGPTPPSSRVLGRLNTGPWRRGKGEWDPQLVLVGWGVRGGEGGAVDPGAAPALPSLRQLRGCGAAAGTQTSAHEIYGATARRGAGEGASAAAAPPCRWGPQGSPHLPGLFPMRGLSQTTLHGEYIGVTPFPCTPISQHPPDLWVPSLSWGPCTPTRCTPAPPRHLGPSLGP